MGHTALLQHKICSIGQPVVSLPLCSFEFHEVGDFTLLAEGRGWKVDGTFAAGTFEVSGC